MLKHPKWLLIGSGLFIAAILAGAALGWLLNDFQLTIQVRQQKAQVHINGPVSAQVEMPRPVSVRMQGKIEAQVPIDQTIAVPVKDTIHTLITIKHSVPIKTNILINQKIPINQTVHVDGKVKVKILGKDIELPVRGDIPIKATIPVHFTIPINQNIPLNFSVPVNSQVDMTLQVPIKSTITTVVPIKTDLQVQLQGSAYAKARVAQPVDINIVKANLHFPLKAISLHHADSAAGKEQ